ncbi:restriction endonuclease [Herminiimonas fonticola]|uniref:Restriction system protein n=1 Tax=Herminiimonas fonticola TaxID=303380 RepID=A0A4R6GFX4_9BURK|nr:restriction endonuclease [Herminiimonas fonticola]RBA24560.1 Restriction endonuclease [Herminiimonas fonticola]TDN93677.1 restriction system protein [Herminiimonas fonticola]
MARKRKQSGIDLLVRSPWWISAALGTVGFIVLRWVIPSIFAANPFLVALGTLSKSLAWLVPCGFGLIALISFFLNKRSEPPAFTSQKQKKQKLPKEEPSFNINGPDEWANNTSPASPNPDVITPAHTPTWSIESLRSLEWKRFELLCAKYYEAAGFKAVTIAAGADGGIDVKLFKTDLNTPIAIVQCKAWSKAVGVKEVRELLGVMVHEKVARGIFITNGTYTPDALAFGASNPIQLLDGNAFLQKIQVLDSSAQEGLKAFAFDGDYKTPTCASCGIKMIKKKAFWGCSNFPRCRSKIYFKNAAT